MLTSVQFCQIGVLIAVETCQEIRKDYPQTKVMKSGYDTEKVKRKHLRLIKQRISDLKQIPEVTQPCVLNRFRKPHNHHFAPRPVVSLALGPKTSLYGGCGSSVLTTHSSLSGVSLPPQSRCWKAQTCISWSPWQQGFGCGIGSANLVDI